MAVRARRGRAASWLLCEYKKFKPAGIYVCPFCGAEDDDEAVITRHMARYRTNGTNNGYYQHVRDETLPCEPCLAAHRVPRQARA